MRIISQGSHADLPYEEIVEPQDEQATPDFMKEQGGAYEDYITGWSD